MHCACPLTSNTKSLWDNTVLSVFCCQTGTLAPKFVILYYYVFNSNELGCLITKQDHHNACTDTDLWILRYQHAVYKVLRQTVWWSILLIHVWDTYTCPQLCGLRSAAMRLMFPLARTIKTIFAITLINIQILLRPAWRPIYWFQLRSTVLLNHSMNIYLWISYDVGN